MCFSGVSVNAQITLHSDSITAKHYENGFIQQKEYRLESGLRAFVNYSDTLRGQVIGGNLSNGASLKFENNRLVEIHAEHWAAPPISPTHTAMPPKVVRSCQLKGNFKNFELYNGFIYYFDEIGSRTLTEKVTNGVIQYNPRVNLTADQLIKAALKNDLNFNGRAEQRELNYFTSLKFDLDSSAIVDFPFHELNYFKRVKSIEVNRKEYRLADYPTKKELKEAILNSEGIDVQKKEPIRPGKQRHFRNI